MMSLTIAASIPHVFEQGVVALIVYLVVYISN